MRHLVKQQLYFLYDSACGRWSHSHDVIPCTDNEPVLERRSASTKAVDTSWSCKPTTQPVMHVTFTLCSRGRILVKSTIYRSLLIGRDGHLDQSIVKFMFFQLFFLIIKHPVFLMRRWLKNAFCINPEPPYWCTHCTGLEWPHPICCWPRHLSFLALWMINKAATYIM